MDIYNKIRDKNIHIGDKFSTKTALKKRLELPKLSGGNAIKSQEKELKKYLSFDFTNTIKKNGAKTSKEIEIIDIYDTPLNKEDGRVTEENVSLINYFKTLILALGTTNISYGKLIQEYIINFDINSDNRISYYNNYLFNYLKGKINSALNQLHKEYSTDFEWRYDYIIKYKNSKYWEYPINKDLEYIEAIKKTIKLQIVAKYNNKHNDEKEWKDISFRYRNKLYKKLNDDLEKFKNVEKIYKVIVIENYIDDLKVHNYIIEYNPIDIIKNKMINYIKFHKKYIDEELLTHHNKIFNQLL